MPSYTLDRTPEQMALDQARQGLLNRGTSSTAVNLSQGSIDALLASGMTQQQIDNVVASGDWNTTNAANAGNVGQRTSDYAAQAPNNAVFQQGPAWFYKGADGIPRHITDGGALQALLAAGVPQVASPLPGHFSWEDVAREYGELDGALVQQVVTAQQQAQQAARQAAQQEQNRNQALQAARRELETNAAALTTTDGRSWAALPEAEKATWLSVHGGDIVKAASAWQAEAMQNRPLTPAPTPVPIAGSVAAIVGQPGQTPPQNPPQVPPAANLGGRPDTPGLRRWMAEHGGSMNGWDALTDAQRQAYESGQSIIGVGGQPGKPGWNGATRRPDGSLPPKIQTPWGEADIDTPPGGIPMDAWRLWAETMDRLTDDSGIIHDPVTGKPVTNADGSLQRTLTAIDQEFRRGLAAGELTGIYNGANTLDRDRFEEDRTQKLYTRAANPAMSFENELARGSGASYYDTNTGQTQTGVYRTQVEPVTTPDSAGRGTVRTPAFLNVLKSGGYTPTVGTVNAASTVDTPQSAALGEDFFRLQNRKAEPRLTSVQRLIRSSYGKAGGVTEDQQNDLLSAGMPKEMSLRPAFSGR